MTAKMDSNVDVLIEDQRWESLALADLAKKAAEATLKHLNLPASGYEISVLGADDNRIAALNADFRGKPQPTNVLSWPSEERGAQEEGAQPHLKQDPSGITELGDIALGYETCLREAEAANKHHTDHVLHLLVHGILHLLGYDHIRDGDAALMERLEIEILAHFNIESPYL